MKGQEKGEWTWGMEGEDSRGRDQGEGREGEEGRQKEKAGGKRKEEQKYMR